MALKLFEEGKKYIVIDEAMRMKTDILENLKIHLENQRTSNGEDWGGFKILLLGDSVQTKVSKNKDSDNLLKYLANFKCMYLHSDETVRFTDSYKTIVQKARGGILTMTDIRKFDIKGAVDILDYDRILCPTIKQAEEKNSSYIDMIDNEKLTIYKKDIMIMIYKNDYKQKVINGEYLILRNAVKINKSVSCTLERVNQETYEPTGELINYSSKLINYRGYIKPAFAMTIQKAQGLTFMNEKVLILLSRLSTQKSLFYTAISRVRELNQITLCGSKLPAISTFNKVNKCWLTTILEGNLEKSLIDEYNKKDGAILGGYEVFYNKRVKSLYNELCVDLETFNKISNNNKLQEYSTYIDSHFIKYKNKGGIVYTSEKRAEERKKRQTKPFIAERVEKEFYTVKTLFKFMKKKVDDGIITSDDILYIKSFNGSGFDYQFLYKEL